MRSDSEMKEVAALLSKEASEGLATDSLGVRAANLAVKLVPQQDTRDMDETIYAKYM